MFGCAAWTEFRTAGSEATRAHPATTAKPLGSAENSIAALAGREAKGTEGTSYHLGPQPALNGQPPMNPWLRLILPVGAPIVGGLLAGWDRRISARMQSRQGPPIFQPFYDVLQAVAEGEHRGPPLAELLHLVLPAAGDFHRARLFFAGSDLLLVIFALTLAAIFFVLGAYKASSPYSFIGAERELIQMMAYEPMVLLTAIGMYMVTKTFYVTTSPAIRPCWCWRCRGSSWGFSTSWKSSSANRPSICPLPITRTRNWCGASPRNSPGAPWR